MPLDSAMKAKLLQRQKTIPWMHIEGEDVKLHPFLLRK